MLGPDDVLADSDELTLNTLPWYRRNAPIIPSFSVLLLVTVLRQPWRGTLRPISTVRTSGRHGALCPRATVWDRPTKPRQISFGELPSDSHPCVNLASPLGRFISANHKRNNLDYSQIKRLSGTGSHVSEAPYGPQYLYHRESLGYCQKTQFRRNRAAERMTQGSRVNQIRLA
jgi:hypothetical protein